MGREDPAARWGAPERHAVLATASRRALARDLHSRAYNTGGVAAEESIEQARVVTVKPFHDPEHPSALSVPLARPYASDEPTAPASALLPDARRQDGAAYA
jgi:hypothetical protein